MGVRKVVTRSGRSIRGYFPSRKMKAMVPWESTLERDAILLLEFSPEVVRYRAQPVRTTFTMNGTSKYCVPDFEAEFADGLVSHIEVKPSKKLENPEIADRYAAIKRHYEKNTDIWYQILTERELRKKTRLKNLRRLAYHLPKIQDEQDLLDAIQQLVLLPARTVGGAAFVLGDMKIVLRLLAAGFITCNLDTPITITTEITYQFPRRQP